MLAREGKNGLRPGIAIPGSAVPAGRGQRAAVGGGRDREGRLAGRQGGAGGSGEGQRDGAGDSGHGDLNATSYEGERRGVDKGP